MLNHILPRSQTSDIFSCFTKEQIDQMQRENIVDIGDFSLEPLKWIKSSNQNQEAFFSSVVFKFMTHEFQEIRAHTKRDINDLKVFILNFGENDDQTGISYFKVVSEQESYFKKNELVNGYTLDDCETMVPFFRCQIQSNHSSQFYNSTFDILSPITEEKRKQQKRNIHTKDQNMQTDKK